MQEPCLLNYPPPAFEDVTGENFTAAVSAHLRSECPPMLIKEICWIPCPLFLLPYRVAAADKLFTEVGIEVGGVPSSLAFMFGGIRKSCAARYLTLSQELVPGIRLITAKRHADGDVNDISMGLVRSGNADDAALSGQLKRLWEVIAQVIQENPRERGTGIVEGLFLPPGLVADVSEDFRLFLDAYEIFSELELPWRRGYLFHGPPGNGKTKLIRELCRAHGVRPIDLSSQLMRDGVLCLPTAADDYPHAGEYKDDESNTVIGARWRFHEPIRRLDLSPETIRILYSVRVPSVYFLEDLDKFVAFQSGETKHKDVAKISLNEFLKALDGVDVSTGLAILMTTNYPNMIAESLVRRPGRVDRIWSIGLPRQEEMTQFIKHMGYSCEAYPPERVAAELCDMQASMAFAEELVRSLCMHHRRKMFSASEVELEMAVLSDHLNMTDPLRPKWKGVPKTIGLGG